MKETSKYSNFDSQKEFLRLLKQGQISYGLYADRIYLPANTEQVKQFKEVFANKKLGDYFPIA